MSCVTEISRHRLRSPFYPHLSKIWRYLQWYPLWFFGAKWDHVHFISIFLAWLAWISGWNVHVVKPFRHPQLVDWSPASGVEGHALRCEEWHVVPRLCAVWNGLAPQPVQSDACGSWCGKRILNDSDMFLGQFFKRKSHERKYGSLLLLFPMFYIVTADVCGTTFQVTMFLPRGSKSSQSKRESTQLG